MQVWVLIIDNVDDFPYPIVFSDQLSAEIEATDLASGHDEYHVEYERIASDHQQWARRGESYYVNLHEVTVRE